MAIISRPQFYIIDSHIFRQIYGEKVDIFGRSDKDNQNALFSHMLDLKHTFNFSQTTLIKPIHSKKTPTDCENLQSFP